MKPPETVTLIDLEGNPIPLRENVPLHYFTGEYAHIVDFVWQFEETDYRIYIGNSTKVGEATKHYEQLLPLLLFLQDQLTFIRNGMWETLAIYQTTLGRYWEVSFYRTDRELLIELIKIGGHTGTWSNGFGYDSSFLKEIVYRNQSIPSVFGKGTIIGIPFKPKVGVFLKHYPDVFSKLTPWKGE